MPSITKSIETKYVDGGVWLELGVNGKWLLMGMGFILGVMKIV